ncbi:MAG: class I SAM-dependent methyltransferase [Candidatus Krumholzibacteriaceae bacterium]|jgi:23S rRNA (cytosine1962-C5)-methyltransferase
MKTVVLKRGREKSLMRKHPWVFSGAIARVEGKPRQGETVDILAAEGAVLARGSYSPASQITVRVWTFDPQEEVSPEFFHDRLERAMDSRGALAAGEAPHGVRLVNAESDALPGIIVDRYADFIVVQFLSAGAEYWKGAFAGELSRLSGVSGVYERSDADVREKENLPKLAGVLAGREPGDLVEIREGPCRYLVDLKHGHKTGFYLDQRENRGMMGEFARGACVLNCFSYTGGFGIAALQAGAASVTNVDSSASALELARKNAELNGFDPSNLEYVEGDAFTIMRRWRDEGRLFDLIVLDPPKFAESQSQLMRASRGYKDINLLAFKLLMSGGTLFTFSCSGLVSAELFQKIVADAALDAGREAQIVRRLGQSSDHPTLLSFPEGSYLKGLVCRVE